jgi:hypothetical protein
VNKKEYVFRTEDEAQAKEWSSYINKAVSKKDTDVAQSNRKTWKSPHVTMSRFLKESNTFDLLKFKDHGSKSYGIILQTIDNDASKDLLYKSEPEVLYFNHHSKKVCLSPVDEVLDKNSDAFIIPLIGYDCNTK